MSKSKQRTLDYGKGYSDGYKAALDHALAAMHDVPLERLAFRESPHRDLAPSAYLSFDAVVEILRSGPPSAR